MSSASCWIASSFARAIFSLYSGSLRQEVLVALALDLGRQPIGVGVLRLEPHQRLDEVLDAALDVAELAIEDLSDLRGLPVGPFSLVALVVERAALGVERRERLGEGLRGRLRGALNVCPLTGEPPDFSGQLAQLGVERDPPLVEAPALGLHRVKLPLERGDLFPVDSVELPLQERRTGAEIGQAQRLIDERG